ncbi:MAG: hypothetical protein KA260_11910 [Burkholderiales bacterium]|nr:hypothetical protein [Burkholderiales bacterium]
MVEEKRPPAEKPLVVPLTFDETLKLIATGGKPDVKDRRKLTAKTKRK